MTSFPVRSRGTALGAAGPVGILSYASAPFVLCTDAEVAINTDGQNPSLIAEEAQAGVDDGSNLRIVPTNGASYLNVAMMWEGASTVGTDPIVKAYGKLRPQTDPSLAIENAGSAYKKPHEGLWVPLLDPINSAHAQTIVDANSTSYTITDAAGTTVFYQSLAVRYWCGGVGDVLVVPSTAGVNASGSIILIGWFDG